VVDDEVINLSALERLLRSEYNVFSATNAEDALATMEQNDISLIIADHRMPGMTGVELLEKTLQEFPNTIRLILTAYADQKLLLEAINTVHVHGFLVKPYNPEKVKLIVSKWIETYEIMSNLEEKATHVEEVQRQLGGIKHLIAELKQYIDQSQQTLEHQQQSSGQRWFRTSKGHDREETDRTEKRFIAELARLARLRRWISDFEGSELDFAQVMRIGEILIGMGYLTFSQLGRALQEQKEEGVAGIKRLGQIMVEAGLITEEELNEALEDQQERLSEG
jgi:response regulator RpfG family c-di-GMP phosphodiesterase